MSAPYKDGLNPLSTQVKTPLPSLIFSFVLLHELTALVPLVGVFYRAKKFGVGEKIVRAVVDDDPEEVRIVMFLIILSSARRLHFGCSIVQMS